MSADMTPAEQQAAAAAAAHAAFLILLETRLEFAFATLFTGLRLFCRWKNGGFRSWWWDDFFAVWAWVFYAVMEAAIELVVQWGALSGMDETAREAIVDQDPNLALNMQKGSKVMFAAFYALMLLNWSLKFSLLAFYSRLTQDTKWHLYIKCVSGFAVLTLAAAMLTELLHCLPISHNWQILPDPGMECSAGIITNIVIAFGNCSVDALLLVVPFFLLKDIRISTFRKIKIGALLCLGGLVIAFSLLRCILTVTSPATTSSSSVWATREIFVATFAVNAPVLNALFQRDTWVKGSSKSGGSYNYDSKPRSANHAPSSYRTDYSSNRSADAKKMEIYKMTDIETSSKESTKELVDEHDGNIGSAWPPGAVAPVGYQASYPKGSIV